MQEMPWAAPSRANERIKEQTNEILPSMDAPTGWDIIHPDDLNEFFGSTGNDASR
jgi:hypothetical protein